MIDKNGKLFGKINIIDLLIILIVVAALIFVALKFLAPDNNSDAPEASKVQISFYATEIEPGLEPSLTEGAPLYEDLTNVSLGELKSWSVEPAYEYQAGPNGESVKVEIPNNYFVNITAEASGSVTSDGLHVGSSLYCVGAHYTIHVGTAKIYAECSGIDVID